MIIFIIFNQFFLTKLMNVMCILFYNCNYNNNNVNEKYIQIWAWQKSMVPKTYK